MTLTNNKSLSDFRSAIRAEVRRLWTGNGDIFDFFEGMNSAINIYFEQAWAEGARQCGIEPSERTVEEAQELEQFKVSNRQYITRFGEAVEKNSRENGGKLTPLLSRSDLWTNTYREVQNKAQQMACGDIKLKWLWNPLKDHCSSCRKLNGRVYRASIWDKYNIRPQMRGLECGGWRCGCEFVPTDEPVTPGRPPAIG